MTDRDDKGHLSRQIDDNLRKVYQRTLEEDVPDKFLDLLAKLREADKGDASHGK